MRNAILFVFLFALAASLLAPAQTILGPRYEFVSDTHLASLDQPRLDLPKAPLPRLAPELALQLLMEHNQQQSERLAEYTDNTLIKAELPDSSQKGEYELYRYYSAQPRSLSFHSVKFTGDTFVKTNVITRLLQSEVDHVEKSDPASSAISDANYKFSYKGTDDLDGNLVHVYQLKPRRKDPSLFKGKIFIDAHTGSLRRAEGSVSKSPSFFIRKIDFVQTFDDIDGFTVPVEMRSTAKARIIGKAVVSIFHRSYQLKAHSAAPATNAFLQTSSK
jgi:Family of unknown function (DUF5686)